MMKAENSKVHRREVGRQGAEGLLRRGEAVFSIDGLERGSGLRLCQSSQRDLCYRGSGRSERHLGASEPCYTTPGVDSSPKTVSRKTTDEDGLLTRCFEDVQYRQWISSI